MTKMKHIKGIKGIRHFLNTTAQTPGWHVFLDGEYINYSVLTVFQIAEEFEKNHNEIILVNWSGNGVYFTTDANVVDWN